MARDTSISVCLATLLHTRPKTKDLLICICITSCSSSSSIACMHDACKLIPIVLHLLLVLVSASSTFYLSEHEIETNTRGMNMLDVRRVLSVNQLYIGKRLWGLAPCVETIFASPNTTCSSSIQPCMQDTISPSSWHCKL